MKDDIGNLVKQANERFRLRMAEMFALFLRLLISGVNLNAACEYLYDYFRSQGPRIISAGEPGSIFG